VSVTLRYDAKFHADEVPALALDLAPSNPTLQHRIAYPAVTGTLDATTTVAITQVYSDRKALAAGVYTLDLRALTGPNGVALDLNGLKVKGIIIVANPANTAGIVVKDGATNGYLIWGSATGENTVWPGFPIEQIFGNNLAAVSATVKTIDFSSSQADAEFEIILVAGA
jgi:hypothetical protein